MTHYVYLYRDPSRANEPIYVGKGKGRRAWSHLKRTDMHPLVQRLQLMERNGVEPTITMLADRLDEELAYLVEVEAISKFGRKSVGAGPLLNLSEGGEGNSTGNGGALKGRTQTAEHIAKRVVSLRGRVKSEAEIAKLRAWKRPPELGAKIAARFAGKPQQQVTCPHCGKIGGVMVMKRWHFDKCREVV